MQALGTLRNGARDRPEALSRDSYDQIRGGRIGRVGGVFWPVVSATLRIAVLIAIAMLLILVLLPGALGAAAMPVVVGA